MQTVSIHAQLEGKVGCKFTAGIWMSLDSCREVCIFPYSRTPLLKGEEIFESPKRRMLLPSCFSLEW